MTDRELPSWAVRLRQERVRRLWSQKITAVHLRDAADEQTRAALPPLDSIQRYVWAYEAGQHAPGDLYAELYCRAFGLTRSALFDVAAAAYGATAQLCAREADSTQAIALSVRAKAARWRMQYGASAELARQGYECSPATPIRILLASQEANAAALLGDEQRARQALTVAEAATEVISPDSGVSAWSCSRPRQSLFAMSVAIRFHNSDAALGAAQLADTAWASGVPRVTGTWAQIRLGAGIARIIADDLHGALAEIAPVMNLAPEYRMATITAYTTQIEKRLQRRRFLRDSTAVAIRSRVHEFNAKALTRSGRGSA